MSLNKNLCFFAGRLTADPELRTTQSGLSVASFTVAINRKPNKEGESETDFINCVAWRGTAEFVSKYFHKGAAIFVEGEMHQRNYEDKSGNKRTTYECVIDSADFVESKSNVSTADVPADTPTVTVDNIPDDSDLPF